MLKLKREKKIKYRKFLEDYLLKKYAKKINNYKFPTINYRKSQLKML